MSEERGFDVVDRRRIGRDVEAGSEPPGAEQAAPGPAAESSTTESSAVEADAAAAGAPGWEEVPGGPDAEESLENDALDEDVSQGMPELNVAGILRMTVGFLHETAWVKLGLIANPISGAVERDLAEARRAIDALADVLKHVEITATAEEQRELQVMLSNLRINYVQQSNRAD